MTPIRKPTSHSTATPLSPAPTGTAITTSAGKHGRKELRKPGAGRRMAAMTSTGRPLLNRRLAGFGTTVFAEMSALAVRTGSINLGQGFPDTDGPEQVREAAVRALREGRGNQYPPGPGVPELRTAIV
ncbi:hypothetical protein LUW77_15370 [Streptomyces radiopugnans]|nr:hypothetical protein LUW77_15370 [Streptomyces radiopugnans]